MTDNRCHIRARYEREEHQHYIICAFLVLHDTEVHEAPSSVQVPHTTNNNLAVRFIPDL